MRKILSVVSLLLLSAVLLNAQSTRKPTKPKSTMPVSKSGVKKNYPSLLWEISGNGLKKPSYLFGTMHVSNKIAFHLGDSFYNALKGVEVVALETNPETWQDDFGKSKLYGRGARGAGVNSILALNAMNDHMSINSFAIDEYEEAIKAALAVEPSMINGMLYRTTGMDDFEEDTFLDMYIFRVGKKLSKKIMGVENFAESEKLVAEAYRDMGKDQNKKRKSYDYEYGASGQKKIEEAYRKGDLDLLDSLERLSVVSDAFQEKFMFKRNDIQANSIDTILRKHSLFVGVGAAHLAGPRGVIEQLRRKGYTVRPIMMDDRNSRQQETIDKIHSKLDFSPVNSEDSFYTVNIPGKKFYHFTEWGSMDVSQFADLENGAYYVVTRIKTNASIVGHDPARVLKAVDSLLYENIPGKILKKSPIQRNGYQGFEVVNRTRRGDEQRYNIFVTPHEVFVFKMSGTGDFISTGNEANQFFGSVKLKELPVSNWGLIRNQPLGFAVSMPHEPFAIKEVDMGRNRLDFSAVDALTGNSFTVQRMPIFNMSAIEDDSFELSLMEESYASSPFIEKNLSKKTFINNGRSVLDAKYLHKDGNFSSARFLFKGAMYYALVARYKKEDESIKRFFDSFSLLPASYGEASSYTDSSMKFTVKTNVKPVGADKSLMEELEDLYQGYDGSNESIEFLRDQQMGWKVIGNDSIGEKIFLVSRKAGDYEYEKDSSQLWPSAFGDENKIDSSLIYKVDRTYRLPDGTKARDIHLTDTGSSKLVRQKVMMKNGHFLILLTVTDTASRQSDFIENFFSSIRFIDSVKGPSLYSRKSAKFIEDFLSTDTIVSKKARRSLSGIRFDSLDAPLLMSAIQRLSNKKPLDYLEYKVFFIDRLGRLKNPTVLPFLRKLYTDVKDTSEFQQVVLQALTDLKTKESFEAFKELLLQEPPLIPDDDSRYDNRSSYSQYNLNSTIGWGNTVSAYAGTRWPSLYDSMALTKVLFPDLLQLASLDDYKEDFFTLLTAMVDSGYLKGPDYEILLSKLLTDARQQIKKQLAREDKEALEKAAKEEDESESFVTAARTYVDSDRAGSDELDRSSILLMPFYEKNQTVRTYFEQLFKSRNDRILYNSSILFLRNNKPVPDSLLLRFAKSDEYRIDLYADLKRINQLSKFPSAFKNQQSFTKSILISSGNRYESVDTVVLIDKLPITHEGKKGWVYFYKYRRMKDDDDWLLASVGMQPENVNELDIENDVFTNLYLGKFESDQEIKKQLEKGMRELLVTIRKGGAQFYADKNYSMYKQYLSESVKSQRYRD